MTSVEIIRNVATAVIAAIALIVSLLGYRIAKRNEKRAIESSKPLITSKVFPIKDQPGWFHVSWSFENRSSHGYKCNYIEIRKPRFSVGLTQKQAHEPATNVGEVYGAFRNPLPIICAKQKIPMSFTLAKAGANSRFAQGPNHWESVYVRVSRWSFSKQLSMRVSLSSIDIDERESVFTVKRTIPTAPKNSSD